MDHKKFIVELQKRTGLDKNRLNLLMKTTQDIIRMQAINLNAVELDGLGRFESYKRLEFVHEEAASGRTILYPPRIVLRFKCDASWQDKVKKEESEHE